MLLLVILMCESTVTGLHVETISMLVQAFATMGLVVATIIYVLKTGEIARQAKKQAEISTATLEERRVLRKQKRKMLKVMVELPPSYEYPTEELARLTGIDPDEIEDPIIAMMQDGLIEVSSFGHYVLKRTK